MNQFLSTNYYYKNIEKYKSFYSNQSWQILTLDKKFKLNLPAGYDFEMMQIRSKTLLNRDRYKIVKSKYSKKLPKHSLTIS